MMRLLSSIYTLIKTARAFETIFAIYGPMCSKTVILIYFNELEYYEILCDFIHIGRNGYIAI